MADPNIVRVSFWRPEGILGMAFDSQNRGQNGYSILSIHFGTKNEPKVRAWDTLGGPLTPLLTSKCIPGLLLEASVRGQNGYSIF